MDALTAVTERAHVDRSGIEKCTRKPQHDGVVFGSIPHDQADEVTRRQGRPGLKLVGGVGLDER
jgi:hypothetical protein